jgi:hypothetical protein
MTVYGIVIALILVFPWAVTRVVFMGAAVSSVGRSLEHLQRAWRSRASADDRLHSCPGAIDLEMLMTRRVSRSYQ